MLQKLLNWKMILIFTAIVLGVLSSLEVLQTPNSVLNDVIVQDEGGMYIVKIKTNIPIRYENHFPQGPSDFVQIKVRAVSFAGAKINEYIGEESILPGFIEQVPIKDVAFEGKVNGGPFISLRFKQPIRDPHFMGIFLYIPKNSRS